MESFFSLPKELERSESRLRMYFNGTVVDTERRWTRNLLYNLGKCKNSSLPRPLLGTQATVTMCVK